MRVGDSAGTGGGRGRLLLWPLLVAVLLGGLAGCSSSYNPAIPPANAEVGKTLHFEKGVPGFPRSVVSWGGGKAVTLSGLSSRKPSAQGPPRTDFEVQYQLVEEGEFDLYVVFNSSRYAVLVVLTPERTTVFLAKECGGWSYTDVGFQGGGAREGKLQWTITHTDHATYDLQGLSGRAYAFCMPRGKSQGSAFLALSNVEETDFSF